MLLVAAYFWSRAQNFMLRNRADSIEVYKMMHELSFLPITAFSSLLLTVLHQDSPENWLKLTVKLTQDSVSSLHEYWTSKTVCHKKQSTPAQWISSNVTLRRFVSKRWVSLWTRGTHNKTGCCSNTNVTDSHCDSDRWLLLEQSYR